MLTLIVSSVGAARVRAAGEFLRRLPAGDEVFVIAGDRRAGDDLVRALAGEHKATFGIHRLSLEQMASRLAAERLAREGLTPISRLGAQASAAHVAYRLTAKEKLPYLAAVSDYPGFAPSLVRTLQELRLAGVGGAPGEVGALLDEFNGELRENDFSDASLLYEFAADALRSAPIATPVVLLDVRTESRAQRELVRTLIETAAKALATIHPADTATQKFYESIDGVEIVTTAQKDAASSLERLRANLFSHVLRDAT